MNNPPPSKTTSSSPLGDALLTTQLVVSQVSHDMASPIGSLITGLELLQETQSLSAEDQEIFQLLQKSSSVLRGRLDVFRAAFALGGQTINVHQARTICAQYFQLQERVLLKWEDCWDQTRLAKGTLQLVINVLMWLHHKVPRQGELLVQFEDQANAMVATVTSNMLLPEGEDLAILKGDVALEHIDAQHIQPYMIFLLTQAFGGTVTLECYQVDEIRVRVAFNPRA